MTGTRDDIGVIPLAIGSVFQAIEEVSGCGGMLRNMRCLVVLIRFPFQNPTRHYLLRVSYLEVSNESSAKALDSSS